jgi:hypothetical protein
MIARSEITNDFVERYYSQAGWKPGTLLQLNKDVYYFWNVGEEPTATTVLYTTECNEAKIQKTNMYAVGTHGYEKVFLNDVIMFLGYLPITVLVNTLQNSYQNSKTIETTVTEQKWSVLKFLYNGKIVFLDIVPLLTINMPLDILFRKAENKTQ